MSGLIQKLKAKVHEINLYDQDVAITMYISSADYGLDITYHLLTESEVITNTGKSQTEDLMC